MTKHICSTLSFVGLLALASAGRAQVQTSPVLGEFVKAWQVCGPFDAQSVLDPIVPDEDLLAPVRDGKTAGHEWKVLKSKTDQVDLAAPEAFGPRNNAVIFAYAEIQSEKDGDVILGLGSDDSAMAWWNGRQVLVQDVLRGLTVGQDQVNLKMRKGKNTLLLKIYNAAGGWGFAADLRPASGEKWKWQVVLPMTDDEFMDLVERKSFDYFWKEADPDTGLIPDAVCAGDANYHIPCSVASLGFGLSAICIGDSRGWVTRDESRARVIKALKSVLDNADQEHGMLYHFLDPKTGKRAWKSEVSSIDTALFLAGALTCKGYFHDAEIGDLVDKLYQRVDWKWFMDGTEYVKMSWTPESGFGPNVWMEYNELMVIYLLGIGAPSNALPATSWAAWKRPYYEYEGMTYVQALPLFLHQYSHCWVDFRGKRDAWADYFKNSQLATKAHRQFCLGLKDKFPWYSENLWGVTASCAPTNYMVWGGPPETTEYRLDGTVVPCAAGGSMAFTPELCMPVLRELYEKYPKCWGKYGFVDAYNPGTGWAADRYLGIDVGPTLLMIENHRTGNVWNWFMDNPEIEKAMQLAGFKRTGRDLEKADLDYLRKLAKETWDCLSYFVYPATQMPYDTSSRGKQTSATNIGLYLAALAAARDMGFIPASDALDHAGKLLDSVEKFPGWHGFAQCWHGVVDLQPSPDDVWVSVVDTGNLALSLAMAGQAFPELYGRCAKLLQAMDWSSLYDTNACQLYGGYDMKNNKLNPDWRIDTLATDSRSAAFMAIASGKVPPALWTNLQRQLDERFNVKYLKPGWTGGGLFMQYLAGIFLNERDSLMGRSAANLAYDNLRNADQKNLPAWGWSSCFDPDGGYLGWGKLRDEVVTPHASVLAIEDFPKETVANLYTLQQKGVRAPWDENGQKHAFGFRDSINLSNGHVAKDYVVLDQAMLFLSLANFLENGLVRRYFQADPDVSAAIKKIDELAKPEGGPDCSIYEPGIGKLAVRLATNRHLDIPKTSGAPAIDGDLSDLPTNGQAVVRFPDQSEFGYPPAKRLDGLFSFAWDTNCLYIGVSVKQGEVVSDAPAAELYKDDCVELFLDPGTNGFNWGDVSDFQIGLSPSGPDKKAQIYAWFQKCVPPGSEVASKVGDGEYTVEAKIPWAFLNVKDPAAGREIGASFAVHTVNKARTGSAKVNWSYRIDGDKIHLGSLKLVE